MKQLLVAVVCCLVFKLSAQEYTKQDSLRGSITPEREWWDLTYYHLNVEVLPESKSIKGKNIIQYQVLKPHDIMQIDLQSPLGIERVIQNGEELAFRSEGNAHFIQLAETQDVGEVKIIEVHYGGEPQEAIRAPWDGGFSWKKDEKGNHFIATSCQGLGASVWWPCKDHMYDEVDSMLMSIEVPQDLVDVSNGRLRGVDNNRKKKTKTYHWFVSNPINNYGVNINIGDYAHWTEKYQGEKGELDIDNWVLKYNVEKAKKQFQENHRMLAAFEHWFGPYPFYEDSYKLVEAPYLGMEHQSSITYGNGFQNGYLGRDLSGTGWGLKFDFIIVHEAGHEWFANNITHLDAADMWIHESFTAYSEGLFVEYHYGKESGQQYTRGTRMNISNQYPVIGPYGVNAEHSDTDVYYKGANMLNTIRSIVNDDDKWRATLRGLGEAFYHQTVSGKQVEEYMITFLGIDLSTVFDQYLRDTRIPVLEYAQKDNQLIYRWTNVVEGFEMPVDVEIDGLPKRISPSSEWQSIIGNELDADVNYYISTMKY
ncbi:MAG: M1 family metallopeptidase [Cyclobacteriaceae bacterium]